MVFFTWADYDEMDEVSGDGAANCSTTAPWRSPSPIIMATRLSSKPRGILSSTAC
jgi:hypothetical protein